MPARVMLADMWAIQVFEPNRMSCSAALPQCLPLWSRRAAIRVFSWVLVIFQPLSACGRNHRGILVKALASHIHIVDADYLRMVGPGISGAEARGHNLEAEGNAGARLDEGAPESIIELD